MDTLLNLMQWVFLLGCILPIVLICILGVVAFYFGRKWVLDFIEPDVEKLHNELEQMKEKNPHATQEMLISSIIRRTAIKCGFVGAFTGLGGFVTLPIALPIDLLVTARYQAAMVSFIAQVYGYEGAIDNKIATYAVMSGSTELSKMSTRIVQKYTPRIIGKLSSKLIPLFGAALGFGVNYLLARSTGQLAVRWYQDTTRAEILNMREAV